eukprot:750654-Hanusia_phi.AAC.4
MTEASPSCRNGWQEVTFHDGSVYHGEWCRGQRSGQGKQTYALTGNSSLDPLPPPPHFCDVFCVRIPQMGRAGETFPLQWVDKPERGEPGSDRKRQVELLGGMEGRTTTWQGDRSLQPVGEHVRAPLVLLPCGDGRYRYTGDFWEDKRCGEGVLEERGKTFNVKYDENGREMPRSSGCDAD